jgi:hypothetical protein
MADIAKSGTPSLSTPTPGYEHRLPSGFYAGETIGAGDACYIKTSDNKIYKSTGTAANAAAVVDGFAAQAYVAGDAATLFWGVTFNYGAALSPGSFAYLSATAGALADAASTGGTVPVGRVIDATRIYLCKSY